MVKHYKINRNLIGLLSSLNDARYKINNISNTFVSSANPTIDYAIHVKNNNPIHFYESESSGSNFISLIAPDTIPNSWTFLLPSNSGADGQLLSTDGNGISTWKTISDQSLFTYDDVNFKTITCNSLYATIYGNMIGNVNGDLTGFILTNNQPNITSIGTLTKLSSNGDITINSQKSLILKYGTFGVSLNASQLTENYSLTFPNTKGLNGQTLVQTNQGLQWQDHPLFDQSLNSTNDVIFNSITSNFIGDINGDILKPIQTNITQIGALSELTVNNFIRSNGLIFTNNQRTIQLSAQIDQSYNLLLPGVPPKKNQFLLSDQFGQFQWTDLNMSFDQTLNTNDKVIFNSVKVIDGFYGTIYGTVIGNLNGDLIKSEQMNIRKLGVIDDLKANNVSLINQHKLIFYENEINGNNFVSIQGPTSVFESYAIRLPQQMGQSNTALVNDGMGQLSWIKVQTQSPILDSLSSLRNKGLMFFNDNNFYPSSIVSSSPNQITVTLDDNFNYIMSLIQDIAPWSSPKFNELKTNSIITDNAIINELSVTSKINVTNLAVSNTAVFDCPIKANSRIYNVVFKKELNGVPSNGPFQITEQDIFSGLISFNATNFISDDNNQLLLPTAISIINRLGLSVGCLYSCLFVNHDGPVVKLMSNDNNLILSYDIFIPANSSKLIHFHMISNNTIMIY